MVWLLTSQDKKDCKSTEYIFLNILTIYTNDWSAFWHVYCYNIYFFFCEISKYVQAESKLAHFDWHLWKGLACLPSWLGIMNTGWLGSIRSKFFFANEVYNFRGCPIKRDAFLTG